MIRYRLACARGHDFEAWFANANAFDEQKAAGLLACPACGDTEIDKTLMAPAVASGRRARAARPETPGPDAAQAVFRPEPGAEEIKVALRRLRKHVVANADYVGDRFAEEARKIHYEEAEKRGIYGETTGEEARALAEEGIEFHPLPVLPEEHN